MNLTAKFAVFQEMDGITAALAEELFYKGWSPFCLHPFLNSSASSFQACCVPVWGGHSKPSKTCRRRHVPKTSFLWS